jgi:hypothetical protein
MTAEPTAEAAGKVKVGDAVLYVPDKCHAKTTNHVGEMSWQLGWRERKGGKEQVKQLDGRDLRRRIQWLKRLGGNAPEHQGLVLVKPNTPWPATVKAINEDGTLQIDATVGPVTYHMRRVPLDLKALTPHSYHLPPAKTEAPAPAEPREQALSAEEQSAARSC